MDCYPYTARNSICYDTASSAVAITIDGYTTVPANDEAALMQAVAAQPVAVTIAAGTSIQFYSEGVYFGECAPELDHGITVVGYSETADGTKYWRLKNSWGLDWGEQGYIRMKRDVGLCGIAREASYLIKN